MGTKLIKKKENESYYSIASLAKLKNLENTITNANFAPQFT